MALGLHGVDGEVLQPGMQFQKVTVTVPAVAVKGQVPGKKEIGTGLDWKKEMIMTGTGGVVL